MAEATSVPINEAPVEATNPTETAASEAVPQVEAVLDAEFEELGEELIIEDFTIDGICGVY